MTTLVFLAGLGQLGVLAASALVPLWLEWKTAFAGLPRLHRQMYWVYGGYIVLAIVGLGLAGVLYPAELAAAHGLARGVCAYAAVFWGVRLALQAVFDAKAYLTRWWLRLGYHLLSVLFLAFTALFGYLALRGPVL